MKGKLLISLSFIICHLSFSPAGAQTLWMTGSAVPGGVQQLTQAADGSYKFAGTLQQGELRLQTTKKATSATRYLTPLLPDAPIANKGLGFTETADPQAPAWQVPFSEDAYRFTVDTQYRQLRGEVFQPWGELFIAGGATEVGWKCEGKMLPDVEEPASFKFQGQDRWGPKALHPYRQDADILSDQQLRTGGTDTKWTISREGTYRITVDVFHETVKAQLVQK